MLSEKREYKSTENHESLFHVASISEADVQSEDAMSMNVPTRFYSKFVDCMEMYTSAQEVADYLNAHQDWFCRCAQPMQVESLGENGYALTIGRFGAFGYEVEPKVGLALLPLDEGFYRIKTIPVPNYIAPGYDVDFRAAMNLVETLAPQDSQASEELEGGMTRVEWQLDLTVDIQFPKFIHRLPKSLVQSSGDRLLNQIVRQVSRRLTHKVQEDFHKSLDLPFPPKSKKWGH